MIRRDEDELLTALLAGELAPSDARVRERCSRDPAFAREVTELLETQRRVSDVAQFDEETWKQAQGSTTLGDGERVARSFRESFPSPRRGGISRRAWTVAAAVALIGVTIAVLATHDDHEATPPTGVPSGGYLSQDQLVLEGVGGRYTAGQPFRWTLSAPVPGVRFRVVISPRDPAAGVTDPIYDGEIYASEWTPPTDVPIPAEFVLEVYAFDSSRQIVGQASAAFSLSPRGS